MLELAIIAEAVETAANHETVAPTLSHFYAVAMNASQNGTSAISAGESTQASEQARCLYV